MNTVRIEEVVGDFVTLKRRGVNLLGLCPFHNEKTPSFTVSPAKGIYKCFGCGKAGNSVNFIMDHEQLSYPEALKYLAAKYHIEVEETIQKKEEIEQKTERDSLFILMGAAQKFYSEKLNESEDGKTIALPYLKERELKPNIIESFQLGWSGMTRDEFSKWAVENGYSKEYLVKTGMAFETDSGLILDRFHERIMFPIHNIAGKVAGFGGRILKNNVKEAKYINSPETDIYNKSKILYGLFQARKAIRQKDECIVVEGYMDVLALHQAGIENVAASSGTSLTEDQLRLVKRFTDNVTFLFDGDAAGQKASLRAIDMALEQELNVKMLSLPVEHDPDSFVKAFDIETVEKYFKDNSKNFVDFRAGLLSEDILRDPIKKSEVAREMISSVILIRDNIKRSLYIREIAKALDIEEKLLNDELRRMAASKFKKENNAPDLNIESLSSAQEQQLPTPLKTTTQEEQIIKILLLYGDRLFSDDMTCAQYIYRAVSEMDWENKDCFNIFLQYKEETELENKVLNIDRLIQNEPEGIRKLVYDLITDPNEFANWDLFLGRPTPRPNDNFKKEVKKSIDYLKFHKNKKMRENNVQEILKAETDDEVTQVINIQMALLNMQKPIIEDLGIAPKKQNTES